MKRNKARHLLTQPLDKPYRLIPLTHGQNAIVDTEDFERISQWNWYAHYVPRSNSFRAARMENRKLILMHRVIMNCPDELEVDHEDHNQLNNRKSNLRNCTHAQNNHNCRTKQNSHHGFKGVTLSRQNTWIARIRHDGKRIWLGTFPTPEEAARAYDNAAILYHGQFACLNTYQ
jgi:hypothetical protein